MLVPADTEVSFYFQDGRPLIPVVLLLTCFAAVHCERVLLTYEGLRQAGASGDDFTGV